MNPSAKEKLLYFVYGYCVYSLRTTNYKTTIISDSLCGKIGFLQYNLCMRTALRFWNNWTCRITPVANCRTSNGKDLPLGFISFPTTKYKCYVTHSTHMKKYNLTLLLGKSPSNENINQCQLLFLAAATLLLYEFNQTCIKTCGQAC